LGQLPRLLVNFKICFSSDLPNVFYTHKNVWVKLTKTVKKVKMVFRCWESNYFVVQITNLKGWAVYYIILVNYIKAL